MTFGDQFIYLLLLAIPVACISWTITHEEVFREPRNYCIKKSRRGRSFVVRKFFYLFTCEYCFSHYMAIAMLFITDFRMLFDDWRGYLISGFSLVWIANIYMSLFFLVRIDIKKDKTIIKEMEEQLGEVDEKPKVNKSSKQD